MILSTHGIVSSISGVDADWLAYYNRVIAAGGSLSTTEQNATKTLVADLKSAGIWSAMKAIYPMVGASAAACAQNLKSSSFTGTFSSGWTFASTGVTPNGTSAFMDTTFNPISQSSIQNNFHISAYIRTNITPTTQDYLMGNFTNYLTPTNGTFLISRYFSGLRFLGIAHNNYLVSQTSSDAKGFSCASINGTSTMKYFLNGSSILTGTSTQNGFANNNIYIGAINNGGSAIGFSIQQNAFTSIGDGLTDTQASNFYTAVQAFQTTLSRQV